ncbi:hypothetical protein ACFWA7_38530, partial [Streptomyces sp. NPDC059994]
PAPAPPAPTGPAPAAPAGTAADPADPTPINPVTVEAVPASGVLRLRPLEIARLDDDPARPENGRLNVTVQGGR